ncbi:MAG: recombinase family protein [bacterium]
MGYARKKDIKAGEFIEITISSRKDGKQRRIHELIEKLKDFKRLIVTELRRLGRSTAEIIFLINELINQNIRVIVVKQNLDIDKHDMNSKIVVTLLSLFVELERDLVSLRTKEALASKKSRVIRLGKPKGTI